MKICTKREGGGGQSHFVPDEKKEIYVYKELVLSSRDVNHTTNHNLNTVGTNSNDFKTHARSARYEEKWRDRA